MALLIIFVANYSKRLRLHRRLIQFKNSRGDCSRLISEAMFAYCIEYGYTTIARQGFRRPLKN